MVQLLRNQANIEFLNRENALKKKAFELNKKFVDKFDYVDPTKISAPNAPPSNINSNFETNEDFTKIQPNIDKYNNYLDGEILYFNYLVIDLTGWEVWDVDMFNKFIDDNLAGNDELVCKISQFWNSIMVYYTAPKTDGQLKNQIKNKLQQSANKVDKLSYLFDQLSNKIMRYTVLQSDKATYNHLANIVPLLINSLAQYNIIQEMLFRNTFNIINNNMILAEQNKLTGKYKAQHPKIFTELKSYDYSELINKATKAKKDNQPVNDKEILAIMGN